MHVKAGARTAAATVWDAIGAAPAIVRSALVLNCDTVDSATWTDSGENAHTITPLGSPTQPAAALKFGAAGYRGGASKYLRIPDAASLRPRTAAFMVAAWAKAVTISASHCIFTKGLDATDRFMLGIGATGQIFVLGGGGAIFSTPNGVVTADSVYHHYQMARFEGYTYVWFDGILQGSTAGAARAADATDYNVTSGYLTIGSDREQSGGASDWLGDIDAVEYRIGTVPRGVVVVDGVPFARNFPVPTSAPT